MLAILLVALASGQELRQDAPATRAERPSIVLVTIDTLRREHLGCYGYPRPTSPRVDALAAESVLFERAYASMAMTYPSHLSMLTGLYVHEHGRASNHMGVQTPFVSAAGHASVAAALRSSGYRTAGMVSSTVLHEHTGIAAGFGTYHSPRIQEGACLARNTMNKTLSWLATVPGTEPFFLWVHLWDVHQPNTPAAEFAALLAPDDALRAFVARRGLDPAALRQRFGTLPNIGQSFFALKAKSRAAARTPGFPRDRRTEFRIDFDALVALHARYDACVRQVDTEVGRLIDALVQRGSWPHTAFVFTADHGQSLGDGDHLGHNLDTQVNIRVPLLIHFPEGTVPQPARNDALVSLVDLMPTLLAALPIGGLEPYLAQCTGRNVLSPDFAREGIVTTAVERMQREYALVTGRWKYVRREGTPGRLYDLEGACEAEDVLTGHEAIASELERLLAHELESAVVAEAPRGALDPAAQELLDQLEELGYGGGDEDE